MAYTLHGPNGQVKAFPTKRTAAQQAESDRLRNQGWGLKTFTGAVAVAKPAQLGAAITGALPPGTQLPGAATPAPGAPAPAAGGTQPTTGAAPAAGAAVTVTAGGGETPVPSAMPDPAAVGRHVGPTEWEQLRQRLGITPANESQFIVRNPDGMPTGIYIKPNFDPKLTHEALLAQGYQYLGKQESVDAAKKAGKNVQVFNGRAYIVPTKAVGTTDNLRESMGQGTTNAPATPGQNTSAGNPNPFETDFPGLSNSDAPPPPDMVAQYNLWNSTYKIEDAQNAVDSAQSELDALDAAYLAGTHNTQNQLKPMEILRGDQAKLSQQYSEQRTLAQNKLSLATRILEGKQKMVETMVSLTGQTYEYASKAFNESFSRAMDMNNFIQGKKEFDWKVKNAEADNARANLTAFGDAIASSGKSWKDLTASQKAWVNSMEVAAGMPVGTMERFTAAKPQAKLLTTATNDNGDITFIYANPDGTPGMTKVVKGVDKKYHSSNSTPSTTVKSVSFVKNADGGYSFIGKSNAGDVDITPAQYAAFKKENVISLLKNGSAGDKEWAAKITETVNAAKNNVDENDKPARPSADELLGVLQTKYPWIFNGVNSDQLKDIVAY